MAAPPLLRRLTREWNRNNKNGSGTEIKKTGVEKNKKQKRENETYRTMSRAIWWLKNGSGTEIKKTGVEQNKKLNEKMKHVGLENQTCAFTKKQKRENQTCGFKNEKN